MRTLAASVPCRCWRTIPICWCAAHFQKSRSLAGLRLGFAIGSAELIGVLEAVKNSYNSYTVDNLSLLCGAAAMDDEAYFAKTTAAVITTRERVRRALEQMGFSVLPSAPTSFLQRRTARLCGNCSSI